ncbi:MAG TPA: hypothetical protein VKE51_34015 [Vicinamibacterales bacterium]|nr:hypothetical protein [Vicinamibacterales bacterium]
MSVVFYVSFALFAFAGVTLAAIPSRSRWITMSAVALGLLVGYRLGPAADRANIVVAATLIALTCAARLVFDRGALVAALIAGWVAALWASSLGLVGVPAPVALVIAGAPSLAAAYLAASRPAFAPAIVRDEALLITLALGLAAAITPTIVEGWRSAAMLNVTDTMSTGAGMPRWTVAMAAGAVALGGMYSRWKRV